MEIFHLNEDKTLVSGGNWYMDPFKEEEVWFSNTKMYSYFWDNYGLEGYQVWNIIKGLDKDEKHYCLNCGGEVYFRGMKIGYPTFCCSSCRSSHTWKTIWSDSNYRSYLSNLAKERWKDEEYRNYILSSTIHSAKGRLEANYSYFINAGDIHDSCYFYLAFANDKSYVKFGISNQSVSNKLLDGYFILHKLVKNERWFVANLEYYLAEYFKGEWFLNDKDTWKLFKIKFKEVLTMISSTTISEESTSNRS